MMLGQFLLKEGRHMPSCGGIRSRIALELNRIWNTPLAALSGSPLLPVLQVAAMLYRKALRFAQDRSLALQAGRRLPAIVISVGNVVSGGTGKTPLTLWLARYLHEHTWRTAILSRGYGRKSAHIARVANHACSPSQVALYGDEPLLLAGKLAPIPVWVGGRRWLSGQAAIRSAHPEVLLLDDGFQHLELARDLDLVLLDAMNPFGNGALLPLGPLREPVANLARADAIILTHAKDRAATRRLRCQLSAWFPGKPVFACRHRLAGLRCGLCGPTMTAAVVQNQPVVAFAGIAHPEKFFRLVRDCGADPVSCLVFPDHHAYQDRDIRRLLDVTRATRSRFLMTTEKDAVRLPAEIQELVLTAELEIDFGEDHWDFCRYLDEQLALAQSRLQEGGRR
jgi:tetraacyldisaccharide 4'-kinase